MSDKGYREELVTVTLLQMEATNLGEGLAVCPLIGCLTILLSVLCIRTWVLEVGGLLMTAHVAGK